MNRVLLVYIIRHVESTCSSFSSAIAVRGACEEDVTPDDVPGSKRDEVACAGIPMPADGSLFNAYEVLINIDSTSVWSRLSSCEEAARVRSSPGFMLRSFSQSLLFGRGMYLSRSLRKSAAMGFARHPTRTNAASPCGTSGAKSQAKEFAAPTIHMIMLYETMKMATNDTPTERASINSLVGYSSST